ncbi:penicillin-binding transpeptidase domain-containing protein [Nocardioides caldifontis]|uniref:penicillin-binding transpeptidase domain-containing protein n=1 Tax=Nocardioides caldifontis TaxID=2588938 RepID=UPI001939CF2E|nr:penicillin-binding transpeptidase domain-containing protein [Nocardioides caldifontis]
MRMLLPALVTLSLALTSCTSDDNGAEDAADELAQALTAGELPAALFGGEAPQAAFDGVVEGLGDRSPEVAVAGVTEEEGSGEAELEWSWEIDGTTWSYTSTAQLTEGDDRWEVVWAPSLVEPSLEEGERLSLSTVSAARGDILGAKGFPLVTERPVVRYGIDKTKVAPRLAADSAARVARVLGVEVKPYVEAVRAAGDKAFVEAIVLRPDDAREVDAAYSRIRGAVAIEDEMPLGLTRDFAAPILGRVGPVTAELVEESEGRLQAGDVAGLSGLQLRYDEELAGTTGIEVAAVDEEGERRPLFNDGPVDGTPLRTTLDHRLQLKAERVLGGEREVAALVALRPSDGAILVAANGPANEGLNAATYGQYAPGSTFKLVSSLALLRSGLTPQSPVDCPASTVVDGKRFENYDDYPPSMLGRITLRQAVAHSCNTAFIEARDRLDEGTLAAAAEALGLGEDFDLGFPAYFGQVPAPESETEAAADLIGQGRVLASPLTMAAVAGSVAAGRTVVPHLLEETAPGAEPDVPLTGAEARALRGLMRAVVTEGSGSFLAGLPGEIGAKTGTAEHGEAGPGGSLPTHAWMVATRGDLAVAVFVENGTSGSSTAGPLLEAFLR